MTLYATRYGDLNITHNGIAGPGPHLLLVHGAGGQVRAWPGTWRLAADAARSVGLARTGDPHRITSHSIHAIDLPGHGRSGGRPLDDIASLSSAVASALDALELDNVVVVGHSMGGAIALQLALDAPRRLAGLVIVGSSARLAVTDEILNGIQTDFARTVDFIVKYSFDRSTGPFFPAKAREYMLAAGPEAVLADFTACSRFDAQDRVAGITLPVLVLTGENDRMVPPKHSQALADALPGGEMVTVPGCGHFLHLERTALVERPIARFCAGLRAR